MQDKYGDKILITPSNSFRQHICCAPRWVSLLFIYSLCQWRYVTTVYLKNYMTLSYNFLDHIKGDQNKTNFIHKTDTMLLHKSKRKTHSPDSHYTDITQVFQIQHRKRDRLPCSLMTYTFHLHVRKSLSDNNWVQKPKELKYFWSVFYFHYNYYSVFS